MLMQTRGRRRGAACHLSPSMHKCGNACVPSELGGDEAAAGLPTPVERRYMGEFLMKT